MQDDHARSGPTHRDEGTPAEPREPLSAAEGPEEGPPPDLEHYDRPTMPWEREADTSSGGSGLASSGIEFAALVALGFFGGRWLDTKLGMAPWGTIVGTMLSVALAMWRLVRTATAIGERADERERDARRAKPSEHDAGGR